MEALVFSIQHLREAIFSYHYQVGQQRTLEADCRLNRRDGFPLLQATLLDIPQPEELPSEVDLLTAEDLDRYLSQLEPFENFHGYKTTLWGDWLEFNALEVEDRLVLIRSAEEDDDDDEYEFESASPVLLFLDLTSPKQRDAPLPEQISALC